MKTDQKGHTAVAKQGPGRPCNKETSHTDGDLAVASKAGSSGRGGRKSSAPPGDPAARWVTGHLCSPTPCEPQHEPCSRPPGTCSLTPNQTRRMCSGYYVATA